MNIFNNAKILIFQTLGLQPKLKEENRGVNDLAKTLDDLITAILIGFGLATILSVLSLIIFTGYVLYTHFF